MDHFKRLVANSNLFPWIISIVKSIKSIKTFFDIKRHRIISYLRLITSLHHLKTQIFCLTSSSCCEIKVNQTKNNILTIQERFKSGSSATNCDTKIKLKIKMHTELNDLTRIHAQTQKVSNTERERERYTTTDNVCMRH